MLDLIDICHVATKRLSLLCLQRRLCLFGNTISIMADVIGDPNGVVIVDTKVWRGGLSEKINRAGTTTAKGKHLGRHCVMRM